jgi:hypothetical protein
MISQPCACASIKCSLLQWGHSAPRDVRLELKRGRWGAAIKKLALIAISFAVDMGSAFAADMAVKAFPKVAVATFNWSGCYIGGHFGGTWGHNEVSNGGDLAVAGFATVSADTGGFIPGGESSCLVCPPLPAVGPLGIFCGERSQWAKADEALPPGNGLRANSQILIAQRGFPALQHSGSFDRTTFMYTD